MREWPDKEFIAETLSIFPDEGVATPDQARVSECAGGYSRLQRSWLSSWNSTHFKWQLLVVALVQCVCIFHPADNMVLGKPGLLVRLAPSPAPWAPVSWLSSTPQTPGPAAYVAGLLCPAQCLMFTLTARQHIATWKQLSNVFAALVGPCHVCLCAALYDP